MAGLCDSSDTTLSLHFSSIIMLITIPKRFPSDCILTATTIMSKYMETEALPNNSDELISFLKWLAIRSAGG